MSILKKNQNLSNGTISFFFSLAQYYILQVHWNWSNMIKKEALKKLMRVNLFCSNLKTALLV